MNVLIASRKTAALSFVIALVALVALTNVAARGCGFTVEADQLMSQFAASSNAPGLVVSVGRQGELLWSRGYGYADLEQKVPANPASTKFRVGSVVKPMTTLALVKLVTQKKIDLDADVRRYVPTFPKKAHAFTVRQLAGHLAGIRHYAGDEAYIRKHYSSVVESLDIFKNDPLVGKPGEKWSYSSYGYNLLSAVIERGAGKPFLDYMTESVFTPLGMTSTVPDVLKDVVPNRGRYYSRKDGKFYNEPEVDNSYKWASGGILSSSDDLVRFGLAHMNDQLVTPAMRSLVWTEQTTTAGEAVGYGIGWRTQLDEDGDRWIGHGGGSIGGSTQLWLLPDESLVIAMISNLTELDYADVLPKLRALVMKCPAKRAGSAATR